MTVKTILLKGNGVHKEAIAAAAITPGYLVDLDSSLELIPHGTAGGIARKAFAREREMTGDGIAVPYAIDDTALYSVMQPGSEIYGFIANGVNASIGTKLASNGDGTFRAVATPSEVPQVTGAVVDDDDAATNGLVIYLHLDVVSGVSGTIGHLESVTAGNADSDFDIGAGGPTVRVHDDDAAATGGLQVYFDEDAARPEDRFLANNTVTGQDAFVLSTSGQMIRIKHDASASTNGVAVYFDDDAVNEESRLLFVSPTNTAGAYESDDSLSLAANVGVESAVCVALEALNNSTGSAARLKMEVL